jgi:hypothetical protein
MLSLFSATRYLRACKHMLASIYGMIIATEVIAARRVIGKPIYLNLASFGALFDEIGEVR